MIRIAAVLLLVAGVAGAARADPIRPTCWPSRPPPPQTDPQIISMLQQQQATLGQHTQLLQQLVTQQGQMLSLLSNPVAPPQIQPQMPPQQQLPPQQQAPIIIYPPQQQLPIGGQPQQVLPIQGQPQQVLPIYGAPQQQLPIYGAPQQVLPIQGQPQQRLPDATSPPISIQIGERPPQQAVPIYQAPVYPQQQLPYQAPQQMLPIAQSLENPRGYQKIESTKTTANVERWNPYTRKWERK